MNLVNIQLSFESYLIVVHIMVIHAYLDISTFFSTLISIKYHYDVYLPQAHIFI